MDIAHMQRAHVCGTHTVADGTQRNREANCVIQVQPNAFCLYLLGA